MARKRSDSNLKQLNERDAVAAIGGIGLGIATYEITRRITNAKLDLPGQGVVDFIVETEQKARKKLKEQGPVQTLIAPNNRFVDLVRGLLGV